MRTFVLLIAGAQQRTGRLIKPFREDELIAYVRSLGATPAGAATAAGTATAAAPAATTAATPGTTTPQSATPPSAAPQK